MLPFFKPKQIASVIMSKQKPAGGVQDEHKENEQHPALMKHAEDLMRGIHGKDAEAVAGAMQGMHNHFSSKVADAPDKE